MSNDPTLTTSQKDQIHLSIIGSCVSRDAFGLTKELHSSNGIDTYVIDRFIQSINPFSAIHSPVDPTLAEALINEAQLTNATNFYKRNFRLDVQKTWLDYLSEVSSDWLIIDLSVVRTPVIKVKDTYISSELTHTIRKCIETLSPDSVFAQIKDMELVNLSDMNPDFLKDVYRQYFDMLLRLYPEDRIIVLDVMNSSTFIDSQKPYLMSPNYTSIEKSSNENTLIAFAYNCAKEYMPRAHFVDTLPILIGNVNHIWGMHGLHYIDDVYSYMYNCINHIIHSKTHSYDETLYLLQAKVKYTEKLFDLYSHTAMSCVQHERNLLNLKDGLSPGEYKKNGITLCITPEFDFSFTGTATEDTLFFLHSFSKNPLGAWHSIANNIKPGTTKVHSDPNSLQIQLVLLNSPQDIRWINGHLSFRFQITKSYTHQLIRAIIKKGTTVNTSGCLVLESLT